MGVLGAAGLGRHGVVGRAVDQPRLRRRIALLDGFLQRLAARHVVQQQPVDVQKHEAVPEIGDDVAVPDLVEKGLAHGFGLWGEWFIRGTRISAPGEPRRQPFAIIVAQQFR